MNESKEIDWLSIFALIISAIVLAISFSSYVVSKNSHNLSLQQYQDSFQTIWTGKYIKEKEVIRITPTNNNVVIQKAIAHYPDEVSKVEWPIEAPNYDLHIISPIYDIQQIIKNIFPINEKNIQYMNDAKVPIVIESFYTVNGNNMYDKSLYLLEYLAIDMGRNYQDPSIKIKGLIFG